MLIRKIWTGTMAAVAVVAITSWASVATADLPGDVAAALSPDKTPAQQAAAVQALATANAGNQANFAQLVQLVAAGITQQQAAGFTGALAVACGASGNNAQTTQAVVFGMGSAFPEAGGAIVGQAIAGGCSAEVAANTIQDVFVTASGQSLRRRLVLRNPGPGTGVEIGSESEVKSLNLTRLGNRSGGPLIVQEGAMSPTKVNEKGPPPPVYVPPSTEE